MSKHMLALAFVALMVQACRSPTESEHERVIGILDFHGESINGVVSAPDTVDAGVAFEVTITTFGGGCDRAAGATSETSGSQADVTVYDLTPAPHVDFACFAVIMRLPHVAVLRFTDPGPATLRVHGRRVDAGTGSSGVPVIIEKTIIVR